MRISDCSSDGCSSDLDRSTWRGLGRLDGEKKERWRRGHSMPGGPVKAGRKIPEKRACVHGLGGLCGVAISATRGPHASLSGIREAHRRTDRTRAVSGKSAYVSVGLGGGRIIKK